MIDVMVVTAALVCSQAATAERHVRSSEMIVRVAMTYGCLRSKTFRELLPRIDRSDVIVYVRTARVRPGEPSGRVTFLAATASRRYVLVTIDACLALPLLVAVLGHELQHAVEIAGAAEVVDAESLARLYERIGTVERDPRTGRRRCDSLAAVETGRRVHREIRLSP